MIIDQDDDLRDLFKRIGIIIAILLFFTVLLIILYLKKYNLQETKEEKVLKTNEIVFILLRNDICSNCKEIESILENKEIHHITINEDRNKKWKNIRVQIEFESSGLNNPTLICVKEGKSYSFITEINEKKEIEDYIDVSINNP